MRTAEHTLERYPAVARENTSRVHAARVNNGEFVKRRSICAALERAEVVANLILPWNCVTSRRAAPIAFGWLVAAADDAGGIKAKRTVSSARSRLSKSEYKAKALSAFPVGALHAARDARRDP